MDNTIPFSLDLFNERDENDKPVYRLVHPDGRIEKLSRSSDVYPFIFLVDWSDGSFCKVNTRQPMENYRLLPPDKEQTHSPQKRISPDMGTWQGEGPPDKPNGFEEWWERIHDKRHFISDQAIFYIKAAYNAGNKKE